MNRRRGFTLLEVVTAMGVASILLSACVSVVLLAGKAVPNPNDSASCAISAAKAIDKMCGELETATLILQQTSTSITFLVPPRYNDVYPEKINYGWGGVSGNPLTRQYNGGTTVSVLDSVDQFNLTPVVVTTTESYPGIGVEDATESLLIDYSGTTGLGNLNVNAINWYGQYYGSNSWAAGVVGWRPTRATFQARQGGLLAAANVQMYMAGAGLTPIGSALEQYSVPTSSLTPAYAWQSFSFSTIGRLAPATAVCGVVQGVSGIPNSLVAQNNNSAGLVQSNNLGLSWSYIGNRAVQSQLFGKLTRSSTTQYVTSTYLEALQILLRAGPTSNPSVQSTANTLNHPEMLSAYWEAKFTSDPTKLDVNDDGVMDWAVHGGGTFNTATLSGGYWQPGGTQLDSQPGDNFAKLTVVDLRFAATAVNSWAGFNINAARSGTTCAPILGHITLVSDGTQSLTVWRKLSDLTTDTLLIVTGLPAQPTDLHMVIDPNFGTVSICINTIEYGSFAYNGYPSSDTTQSLSLLASGSAEFSYARVREMLH